jgi:hypothetical protein
VVSALAALQVMRSGLFSLIVYAKGEIMPT